MELSQDVLAEVLSAAPDPLLVLEPSGRIAYANAQAVRLFGWPPEELVGARISTLVPGGLIGRDTEGRGGYAAACREDGTELSVEIRLSDVQDDSGGLLVLAAVRDVTERLEVEAERRAQETESQRDQADRLESLGELAGGVAHDFNNLLGVILNYAALLESQVKDVHARADLREIRSAAEHGARLTRQLLTFARRDVVTLEPLDVTDTVRRVASMLEGTIGERIDLRLELPREEMTVLADRNQIEQILVNLVLNARDAMPEGGTICIGLAAATPHVARRPPLPMAVVEVRDSGVGMSAETARRAFEPFFTTKKRGRGTGLGLATAYGIVEAAHGEITIESTPGVGTSVFVALPRTQEGVTAEPRAVRSSGGTERILLVEDEDSLRHGTARLLRDEGYDVVEAPDGLAALAVIEGTEKAPDLVLSDVTMPRMGGDELLLALAVREIATPVVLMSGYGSGPDDLDHPVLEKPVSQVTLLRAVREALDE